MIFTIYICSYGLWDGKEFYFCTNVVWIRARVWLLSVYPSGHMSVSERLKYFIFYCMECYLYVECLSGAH